ncbi:MAG: DNA helicase UvrD [Nitrospirae bacterium RBG_13_41_22]|nr:MAG: DNA helicase UvrD [Nitrospirae bacterium RBG_13_41_22]OHE55698.1 MAG: DNA helicase UvrD [Thermodesulfovibrio sp. RBG_19FT_COMBO_42_12]
MRFIADLHIHSRYSRATSKDMSLENLWRWAQIKGITLLGTGDFTHPKWFQELKEKLESTGNNLFKLKHIFQKNSIPASCRAEVYFMLTAEISCIYKKNGRVRKIHNIVFVPDFATAEKINTALSRIGNLSADGRPILGFDAKKLLKIILDISADAILVPAHAWTPHFSVFGAESGFDSLEECFEELAPYIYSVETGLSSDPPMNWRLSSLDRITPISNSDAHSPAKLGREANIFDTEISFETMINAIKTKDGFLGTIEFFPEEGKYHYDGHRFCGISLSPKETIKHNYLCPVCGKRVTVGVMHRVEKLADRADGFRPEGAPLYYSTIPLCEIVAETLKVGVNSKAVMAEYFKLLKNLGNEYRILMDVSIPDIESAGSPVLSEAISRVRSGNVYIEPGFDGRYGKIKIFEEVERKEITGQGMLF